MKLDNLLKGFNDPTVRSKIKMRFGKNEITDDEKESRKELDKNALAELNKKLDATLHK